MLTRLLVRDLVLVDRLELAPGPGFTVFTGETGAGKSVLLDALGLALGARAERTLVRPGAARAQVVATFALAPDHPVRVLLAERGVEVEEEILIRRELGADGRSRAWIDDVAVSGGLLRQAGALLVEVHGQHASRALGEPAFHRELLDRFGGHGELVARVRTAHHAREAAEALCRELRARREAEAREREELERTVEELSALAPQPGEEEVLAERRRRAMNREKLASALAEIRTLLSRAVEGLGAAERRARRALELDAALAPPAEGLERALIEATEAEAQLDALAHGLELDADGLERIEERLFALRDAARKYRCAVEELPGRLAAAQDRLERLALREEEGEAAERALAESRRVWREAAAELRQARQRAAAALEAAVGGELPPLRLERARFRVALEDLPEQRAGPEGSERVRFEAATNPGQPFGPLDRIASGGELARFMLALELVIAGLYPATTMIFDEIDAGVGGATAAAIGERLARLARERQVIVVTHAPQVAARADHHILVQKRDGPAGPRILATPLDDRARREELARMLAGLHVTEAARAAADSLLATGGSGS